MDEIRVNYSPEDGEWVATCDEFPSLSWLAETEEAARTGMVKLLAEVRADIESENNEE